MDERTQAQLLQMQGRIAAIAVAIRQLIEASPRPNPLRARVIEGVQAMNAVFEQSGDDRLELMALGMREQVADLVDTG